MPSLEQTAPKEHSPHRELHKIVVDLGGFRGVSPTFLKFLVRLQCEAIAFDYTIHLVGVTPYMKHIIETIGITQLLSYEIDP